MKGRAFLDAARRLAGSTLEEDWRTAAGRSYYAILLEARDMLQRNSIIPPARDSLHAFVRLRFSYASDSELRQIGYVLDQLNRLRNLADYDLAAPSFASNAKAQRATVDAENSLIILDQIEADPTRRATAAAALQAAGP